MGGLEHPGDASREPRVLDLGELERVRDELAERLHAARLTIAERAEIQAANRVRLEKMLLEPGKYRFVRIARERRRGAGLRRVAGQAAAWPDRHADGLVAGQALLWLSVSQGSRCGATRPA